MEDRPHNKIILLLGPSLHAVSGVSTHLNQLLDSTLSRRFNIVHFQVGSEGRKASWPGKLLRLACSPFALALQIIYLKAAIVHLNTSLDAKAFWRDAVYLMVSKLLGSKVVYQIHGGVLDKFTTQYSVAVPVIKWILHIPDAVVVLSNAERNAHERFSHPKRLTVIPNAIDAMVYQSRYEGTVDESQQLVYVGRLAYDKGIFETIEAINILRHENGLADLRFLIAGGGPEEPALRNRVQELGLEKSVKFVGPIFEQEKIHFWHNASLFVFPTFHQEGLPYSVLESLASGTPIITTRNGGIPDVVHEGVHGIFVEPHNPPMVAAAVKTLLLDKARLKRMAAACVKRVREHYGIDRMAQQFANLYLDIMP